MPKYNEEIIEINKKHNIVSGILNIVKKRITTETFFIFKKNLSDYLKNLDKYEIKDKKLRQNNFIYVFGKKILKLYNKEMERRSIMSLDSFTDNNGLRKLIYPIIRYSDKLEKIEESKKEENNNIEKMENEKGNKITDSINIKDKDYIKAMK